MTERQSLHALTFDDPFVALSAVERLRGDGYDIADVHSPFPVHGMAEAMGLPESRLGFATLFGGAVGLTIALTLQIWTHTVDWPMNIGGKTDLAWPALVPVAFELTVLLAAFATVFGLLGRSRLIPQASAPKTLPAPRVTSDHFVVLVREGDARFDPDRFRDLARELCPLKIQMAWRVL